MQINFFAIDIKAERGSRNTKTEIGQPKAISVDMSGRKERMESSG
jgi:hypothetical protein